MSSINKLKSKARSKKSLKRKGEKKKDPYDHVLIVCEGEKTEPFYFEGLIEHHKLNSANVKIISDGGNDPCSVLRDAKKLYKQSLRSSNPYDYVYCVFDRDEHDAFYETVVNVDAFNGEVFHACFSIPCFEFWYLLHFTESDRPFLKTQNKTASENVVSVLKENMGDYKKNDVDIYRKLLDRRDDACVRAARILDRIEMRVADNPSTKVHALVEKLINLKEG